MITEGENGLTVRNAILETCESQKSQKKNILISKPKEL